MKFEVGPTTSTLYFAKSAALVKVKPKKKIARVNWAAVAELQKTEIDVICSLNVIDFQKFKKQKNFENKKFCTF